MPVYSLLCFSTTTGWHGQALWQPCHVPVMPHGGADTRVYTLFVPAVFQHCPLLVQDHLSKTSPVYCHTVTWECILICLLYHSASLYHPVPACLKTPVCMSTVSQHFYVVIHAHLFARLQCAAFPLGITGIPMHALAVS